MAKKPSNDRQAVIDSIRSKQSRSENRRGMAIVGVCVLVAVLIVGAAAFKPLKDWWGLRAYASDSLGEIGAKASVCQKVTTKKAEGNQDHVDVGTPMTYPDAPPAFGEHRPQLRVRACRALGLEPFERVVIREEVDLDRVAGLPER